MEVIMKNKFTIKKGNGKGAHPKISISTPQNIVADTKPLSGSEIENFEHVYTDLSVNHSSMYCWMIITKEDLKVR